MRESPVTNPTEGPGVFGDVAGPTHPCHDENRSVAALHAAIDRTTSTFQERTALRCPDGCGWCCLSPDVETSAVDVGPLAAGIVRQGRATEFLDRIETHIQAGDRRCVLYEPDPADPARGRCSMYTFRPSICRLFGFAGRRDADGRPQFVACRVHGERMPETVAAAREAVADGTIRLPIFAELAGRIAAIATGPRGRPQPINHALREAIHAAGLKARLTAADESVTADDDQDGDGTRPTTPPRRAA
jgi:Fe-S-cluster containining protein